MLFINHPHISVIIPTYNRAALLIEAVESVLAQTWSDFELIVVDDGSTDDTPQCLKKYSDRLIYLRQENRGVSAARNYGIANARGEWLAFLDSDDLWLPRKLAAQVDFFRHNPTALICQTEEIWRRDDRRVNPKKIHQKHSGWIYERCLPLCIVSPSAVMMRRSLLDAVGLFDETLPACEDYDLWLRIGKDYPIYLIDEPLIIKRGGHDDQLSRQHWGMDRFRIRAMQKLLDADALNAEQRRLTVRELQHKCDVLIKGFAKRARYAEADYYQALRERYAKPF